MTEPIKTPAQILNEHTPLGKGYHSSWIIPAMEEYASLKVAQERERIIEKMKTKVREDFDNSRVTVLQDLYDLIRES